MSGLAAQPDPVLLQGRSLRVLVSGFDARGGATGVVAAHYVGDGGFPLTTRVVVTGDGPATTRLRQCRIACFPLSLTVDGTATFDVRRVVAGTQDLLPHPVSLHRGRPRPGALVRGGRASAGRSGDAGPHHSRRDAARDRARRRRREPRRPGRGSRRRAAVPRAVRQPARPATGPPRRRRHGGRRRLGRGRPCRHPTGGPGRGCARTAAVPPRSSPPCRRPSTRRRRPVPTGSHCSSRSGSPWSR